MANKRGLRCGILPHGWMPTPLKGFMTKKGVGVGGKGAEMGCECPTRPKCSLQGLPFFLPPAPPSAGPGQQHGEMAAARTLLVGLLGLNAAASQYAPTWDSLDTRPLPTWYDDAKVGSEFSILS